MPNHRPRRLQLYCRQELFERDAFLNGGCLRGMFLHIGVVLLPRKLRDINWICWRWKDLCRLPQGGAELATGRARRRRRPARLG